MKKLLILSTALFAIATYSFAQKTGGGFRIGAKAGANLTKISGKSFSEEFNLTYQVGGFIEIDFNNKIGIQPEVLWSQTQGKTSTGLSSIYTGLTTSGSNSEVKLDYLNIPILLRYNVGKLITLQAGPQFGIAINKNENIFTNGRNAFKDGDFSLVAGTQLNLGTLRIYGRYNIGLSNLNDVDDKDKWTSQQIQLGLGFRF